MRTFMRLSTGLRTRVSRCSRKPIYANSCRLNHKPADVVRGKEKVDHAKVWDERYVMVVCYDEIVYYV